MGKRVGQQYSWDDFPVRKEADGWHCRKCCVLLTGRKRAWCSKQCLKEVLLLVEWRYIRACILRRDHHKCQICGNWASEVDHIVELTDGGSFHDWTNLRSLCEKCHNAKTQMMRKARAATKKTQRKAAETEVKEFLRSRGMKFASLSAARQPDNSFKFWVKFAAVGAGFFTAEELHQWPDGQGPIPEKIKKAVLINDGPPGLER
jgi:HNH endonuclease